MNIFFIGSLPEKPCFQLFPHLKYNYCVTQCIFHFYHWALRLSEYQTPPTKNTHEPSQSTAAITGHNLIIMHPPCVNMFQCNFL